jgi:isocitrate dehydrogenase (NAD+)
VGIEQMVGEDAAESIKIITRKASERIAKFAFELARKEERRKVTAVHKANIMKCTDGLFLDCVRKVSQEYPEIIFEDVIVDAMCMNLVQKPQDYEVLVMPNLYGDILSDLAAGLVGGLGVVPGANTGNKEIVFEPVHGSAPELSSNIANPTATILSGVMMLKYLGEREAADRVEKAVVKILKEGKKVTPDLGGNAGTAEYTQAVVEAIE